MRGIPLLLYGVAYGLIGYAISGVTVHIFKDWFEGKKEVLKFFIMLFWWVGLLAFVVAAMKFVFNTIKDAFIAPKGHKYHFVGKVYVCIYLIMLLAAVLLFSVGGAG